MASLVGSLVVAALGAQSAVRRAVRIPPAEAMRPEPPARYRRSMVERPWRRVPADARDADDSAQPRASAGPDAASPLLGIAFAVAVLFVGLAFIDVMDMLIDQQFDVAMRQDATVTFVEPRSARALHDVEHLPGVMDVEPMRSVPVRLRAGHRIAHAGDHRPAADAAAEPRRRSRRPRAVAARRTAWCCRRMLGDILGVAPGESLQVEVLEGRRPVRDVPVAALVDDAIGLQAYMQIDAVRRMLREGGVDHRRRGDARSGARSIASTRRSRRMPAVAGVALREVDAPEFP